jgi:hypothetical protein
MKNSVRTASMAVLLLATTSGAGALGKEEWEETGQPELQAVSPVSSSPQSVWSNGCQYTLAMVPGPHPALRSLTLTREPSSKCEAQSVTFAGPSPSFMQPVGFVLLEKRNALVVAWLHPLHQMYGVVGLILRHVSTETLETVRQDFHVPYYRSGAIQQASLEFQGHRLIVHGTKTGVFSPDEPWGVYPHFTATYPHYLTSTEPPALVLHE